MDHSYFDEPSLAQRPWNFAHRPSGTCRSPAAGELPFARIHPVIRIPPPIPCPRWMPLARRPRRAAASTEALALEHVRHRYSGMVAVDDVSLSIAQGEILCLVGPSGCGKSTLLRIAAGLEALQRGTVRINGKVVADDTGCMPPERRGVGLVFQDYALFPASERHRQCPIRPVRPSGGAAAPPCDGNAGAGRHELPTPTTSPMPCPAVSSSAWLWRGRWHPIRRCSCWTSRSPGLMPGCANRCGTKPCMC